MLSKIKEKFDRIATPTLSLEKEIVGIDLSHHYLRVVQLTNKKNDWSITRIATQRLSEQLASEQERHDQVVELLKDLKAQQKFDTGNAAISLPINDAIIQIIQIPYLEDEYLINAIENGSLWQNSINLPGDLTDYSIFWQVVKSDPANAKMSILFVASSVTKVNKLCNVVKAAGFNPVFVDVRCFALRNISKLYDSESEEISVYLEVSGYENYMVFIHQDMPFIYDIFVTDSDINTLITNDAVADNALYARIASQVNETIELFLKQSGEGAVEIISLVSSLNRVDEIKRGLSLSLPAYTLKSLNPFDGLRVSPRIKSTLDGYKNFSAFSVALGLATRRLDILNKTLIKAVANINLLPNRLVFIEKETKKSKGQIVAARIAAYLTLLMVLSLILYSGMRFALPSEAQIIELDQKNESLRAKLTLSNKSLKEYSTWINEVENKNKIVADLDMMDQIPLGVYVLDVKQVREGLSEISLQTNNPALVSDVMDKMSKKYKNVKLISVEGDNDNAYQISKIIFEIK